MYEAFLARLAAELIRKFGRNIGDDTFCTDILSEYHKNINYFSKKYSHDLTSLSALEKEKNTLKLNSLSEVKVDNKTIKNFLRPFLDNPENKPEQHENINEQPKKNGPHTKTLDYLCVSLGYFGWLNFRRKKKENIPEIITSDNKIGNKDNKGIGVEEHIESSHSITSDISGTTIIDESFVEKIQKGKVFSMAEFYTAKQNEHCQWFGILHQYDIERKQYPEIKKSLKNSFNRKELTYKVAAVLLGDGGSGKSTLLRKLALDWCIEAPFQVVWLIPESLEDFVKSGLGIIKENSSENYMLIIEDWQILQTDEKNAKILLEKCNKISNIRLCIGNRNNDNALYLNYMYDQDHTVFTLKPDENKEIITQIIQKFPDWKETASKIFECSENYSAPLFLLLFLLASSYQTENNTIQTELSEPMTAFRSIIRSDFERISKKNEGMAKAIYYYACFYSSTKVPLLYESFLLLSEHFNGNKDPGLVMDILQTEDHYIPEYLSKYFNLLKLSPLNLHSMHFNHDLFSELAFSKMHNEAWGGYEELTDRFMAEINMSFIKGKMTLLLLQHKYKNDTKNLTSEQLPTDMD